MSFYIGLTCFMTWNLIGIFNIVEMNKEHNRFKGAYIILWIYALLLQILNILYILNLHEVKI